MNPLGLLFFLFILVPIIEMYFLIRVGSAIGAIPTIGLVVFTALLGAMLVRFQGMTTLQRTRRAMAQGQVPALEMFEGVLLLFAGVLLLTPGFFTDTIGFTLLIPPLRKTLIRWFISRSNIQMHAQQGPGQGQHRDTRTIEGEYHRDDN
ncbi:FxsA protein [hydrothermal vent metagenome]|uniref:FxsA protein n=1 Tax=hydrothermal vent metagenome TaxID=652676 RepID=A0A3B0YJ60_9ZZZZ